MKICQDEAVRIFDEIMQYMKQLLEHIINCKVEVSKNFMLIFSVKHKS